MRIPHFAIRFRTLPLPNHAHKRNSVLFLFTCILAHAYFQISTHWHLISGDPWCATKMWYGAPKQWVTEYLWFQEQWHILTINPMNMQIFFKLIINNLAVGMPLQHLCLSYFHASFIAKSCQYASSASLPNSWFSSRSFPAMPPSALISSRWSKDQPGMPCNGWICVLRDQWSVHQH